MSSLSKPKLTSKQLLAKREEVVALHQRKTPVMEIVKTTGLSWPAVNRAITLFETGGKKALQPKTGRTEGSGRTLSPEQEDTLKNILYTKQPNEVRIISLDGKYYTAPTEDELIEEWLPYKEEMLHGDSPQYLWCRDSVKALVDQISGIVLSDQAIRNYLQRWEFPKKKLNQRPISRCSEAIQDWLRENPQKEAYWLHRQRLSTKDKQSMISATDNKRKEYWTVIQGNFSEEKQINFLKKLKKQTREPITIIRHDYNHYTKERVSKWLSRTDITLLPPLLEPERQRLENDWDREIAVRNELLAPSGIRVIRLDK